MFWANIGLFLLLILIIIQGLQIAKMYIVLIVQNNLPISSEIFTSESELTTLDLLNKLPWEKMLSFSP